MKTITKLRKRADGGLEHVVENVTPAKPVSVAEAVAAVNALVAQTREADPFQGRRVVGPYAGVEGGGPIRGGVVKVWGEGPPARGYATPAVDCAQCGHPHGGVLAVRAGSAPSFPTAAMQARRGAPG